MAKSAFRKGDTVRFADTILRCETHRPLTREEEDAWWDSPASKGMGCDGETKLAPRGVTRRADSEAEFTVVRARVVNRIGWRERMGYTLVVDSDGVEWHIRRCELVKVPG